MGENVVVYEGNDDSDMVQGALNSKFQRLLFNVGFVLIGEKLKWLNKALPGLHFHCTGHRNHDHPISHVVTMWGTRQLQRMIPAGSRILDVGGNPNAAESFNAGQTRGNNPKQMTALVANHGGADFIREVTKWGHPVDTDGNPRYFRGSINRFEREHGLVGWDAFQLIHTLYYHSVESIMRMVHAQRGTQVLALVHTHPGESGFLHSGEQEYQKKNGYVKQRNVLTGTSYTHPDIAPFYFKEKKTHWGSGESAGLGMQWECHLVCENTWIIQIVAARKDDIDEDDCVDFDALWEGSENTAVDDVFNDDYLATDEHIELILNPDGTSTPVRLTSMDLVDRLRAVASGRERNTKLLDELFKHAKSLTSRSALMPDQAIIDCEPQYIVDHVAFVFTDVAREGDILKAVVGLRGSLAEYNESVKGGGLFRNATLNTLLAHTRNIIGVAQTVNKIVKTEDKIGKGLAALADATGH